MQLYIEIVDHDDEIMNQDELIDRFAINLTDASNFTSGGTYTGVFGFAEIELTFELICADYFYGPSYSSLPHTHRCQSSITTSEPRHTYTRDGTNTLHTGTVVTVHSVTVTVFHAENFTPTAPV